MLFSLSSWKKSPKSADGADAPTSRSRSSKDGEGSGMRNKAMILIAVLGVGALGYKMFWPDSEPMKAAAGTTMPKMTAPKASGNANRPNVKSATTPRTSNNDDTT